MADSTTDMGSSPSLAPSKSVASLCNGGTSNDDRSSYLEIYHTLGLTGDDDERISLAQFRRIITKNLEVDTSFMYKRVFRAFDKKQNGYLTAIELVSAMSVLLQGPFRAHVELGLRVYGRKNAHETNDETLQQEPDEDDTSTFTISRTDAILSIVESLQLCNPRARHTLTNDNRESSYHIGEDLVFIIFPKLDIDGDGVISLSDFSKACHEDPSLIQVFGQYLPRNNDVQPSPTEDYDDEIQEVSDATVIRPVSSRSSLSRCSFEGIDYLRHSPTIGTMWGRQDSEGTLRPVGNQKSERLEPISIVEPK